MIDDTPPLPNFFIVGAPKAGTTSLYAYLDQHPQVYMSPLKEPHYFASEFRAEHFIAQDQRRLGREQRALEQYLRGELREKRFGGFVTRWEDYLKLFRNAVGQVAIGEATACYLWSPSAAGNIGARIPGARIIINLRNPADRAFSQYLQMLTSGRTHASFSEELRVSRRCASRRMGEPWPLLEFGRYCDQVRRYLDAFPQAQVHVSLYEDLAGQPEALLSRLFSFLGVAADFAADVSRRHHQPQIARLTGTVHRLKKWGVWPHVRQLAPRTLGPRLRALALKPRAALAMQASERAWLIDFYREDIEQLAALIGRDLSAWLKPPDAALSARAPPA